MEHEVGKGKQLHEDKGPSGGRSLEEEGGNISKDVTKDSSEEGSEDSGPYFEDLLSPGGEHLHLGLGSQLRCKKLQECKLLRKNQWLLMSMAQISLNTSLTL
jgi:hypothetical protein